MVVVLVPIVGAHCASPCSAVLSTLRIIHTRTIHARTNPADGAVLYSKYQSYFAVPGVRIPPPPPPPFHPPNSPGAIFVRNLEVPEAADTNLKIESVCSLIVSICVSFELSAWGIEFEIGQERGLLQGACGARQRSRCNGVVS